MDEHMKAWLFTTTTGGMEKNLYFTETATPPSKEGLSKDEVIVEVISAALNPVDYKLAEIFPTSLLIRTPASPGVDFCGKIVAIPTANDTHRMGQVVFGRFKNNRQYGTLGQYVVADVDGIATLPDGVDPDDAATVGTAGLTAYQTIVPHARETQGARVFLNGGSGGCGTWGIQIAKAIGAHVTTSCSTANIEFCKELGADEVLDYTKGSIIQILKEKGEVFDVVVDNVGTPENLYEECHHFLKPDGHFFQVGVSSIFSFGLSIAGRLLRPSFLGGGKRPYHPYLTQCNPEHLAEIGRWITEGKVKPVIHQTFEWEDTPKAYERLKTQRTKGKIVVHVTRNLRA
ncbi:putative zinc alcohol dehydrogenase [Eremomyces bilateralis CBS 781.70]|uniref:Zinc alcohol dehydrogenase n=1 Tax=Eremomyces bilateralis CBS 781.70 TaxID=1392243 RepID=A0A6G1G1E7_9PEZI|nr:putative zinc alcohol dehydrogenase [Eremomyces bilateralis CBS 781.70]KAF1811935.1 putative zinc alcohol dehydrogenase [Eremomyces bilateralis CBS 781.70]